MTIGLPAPPLNAADSTRPSCPDEHEQLVAVSTWDTRAVLSFPVVTTCSPSALNDDVRQSIRVAGEDRGQPPVGRPPDAAVPSVLALATSSPSGLNATATALPACSVNTCTLRPLWPDHTRTVSSTPPVRTRRLSGEIAADCAPGCGYVWSVLPVETSTRRTPPGWTTATTVASGEIAAATASRTPARVRYGAARRDHAHETVAARDRGGPVVGERRPARPSAGRVRVDDTPVDRRHDHHLTFLRDRDDLVSAHGGSEHRRTELHDASHA